MVHPVVAVTKKGAPRSLAILQRWASSAGSRRAGGGQSSPSPSSEAGSDFSLAWGVGGEDQEDLDAPSSAAFFDGGGGLGDGDLFSSLLAGFADDPVVGGVVGGFEACGIDVADMTSKALAAFFATPGIADADFTSPGALADPAASLGLVAPILLALRDDDEGDCGEDDSSLIQAAFEGYLQCSGGTLTRMLDLSRIHHPYTYLTVTSFPRRLDPILPSFSHPSGINEILDPLDPVDAVSLSQDLMELCTPFLDLVANMDPTLDVGDGSDFEREGTRCLQSLLGDNPFGNLIRYEYDHLDKVRGYQNEQRREVVCCVPSMTGRILTPVLRTLHCIIFASPLGPRVFGQIGRRPAALRFSCPP